MSTGGSPEGIQCYGQGDRPPSGEGALMVLLYVYIFFSFMASMENQYFFKPIALSGNEGKFYPPPLYSCVLLLIDDTMKFELVI